MGCSRTAEDSIEHYVNCPFTQELGSRYLRMNRQQINMHTFMMCNPHVATAEDLTAAGVLILAVYMATNHQRHNTPIPTTAIHAALTQWAREGVMGYNPSTRVLRERWLPHPRTTQLPSLPLIIVPGRIVQIKRSREYNGAYLEATDQPMKRRNCRTEN